MPERLSATDAAYLYAETPNTPQHVGGVVILDPGAPSTAGAPQDSARSFDYQDIVELIESRLPLVPRYRQRVRFVPGRLARPVWVDDDDFDLGYHVRRSALARPGTQAQLDELVGRLISRPLDRDRPLWEVYVVEGLAGGRVAVVNKTHEAMVDRIGAVDVAAAILDVTRRPRRLPEEPAWLPVPPPSDIDLVVDALADLASRPSDVAEVARMAAGDVRAAVQRAGHVGSAAMDVVRRVVRPAPQSVLTSARGGQRRFAGFRADLARLKRIRARHQVTLNDVILGVLTGALRSWLLAHAEAVTPSTSLRALVPMYVRTSDSAASAGPPVVSFVLDLPVAEPNPTVRLHQLSFATGAFRESGRSVGAESLLELGRFAPPTLHALGARVAGQLSARMYNMLITNVPGPQIPLYAAGWPVVAMYPVAPLTAGQALAVAVTSYHGGVFFGLTADRDAIPDVTEFAEHIGEAIDELLPPPAPRRRRTPKDRT